MLGRNVCCLSEMAMRSAPTSDEMTPLMDAGRGLKCLKFKCDGDALHVHGVIVLAFPQLEDWGIRIFSRWAKQSFSDTP